MYVRAWGRGGSRGVLAWGINPCEMKFPTPPPTTQSREPAVFSWGKNDLVHENHTFNTLRARGITDWERSGFRASKGLGGGPAEMSVAALRQQPHTGIAKRSYLARRDIVYFALGFSPSIP